MHPAWCGWRLFYGGVLLFIEITILLNPRLAENFSHKEMLDDGGIGGSGCYPSKLNPAIKSSRLSRSKKMFLGNLIEMIFEALIFLALGFFIYRNSHIAAALAVGCFAIDTIRFYPPNFDIAYVAFSIFIIVLLAYGVRGTLALKKIKAALQSQ